MMLVFLLNSLNCSVPFLLYNGFYWIRVSRPTDDECSLRSHSTRPSECYPLRLHAAVAERIVSIACISQRCSPTYMRRLQRLETWGEQHSAFFLLQQAIPWDHSTIHSLICMLSSPFISRDLKYFSVR